MRTHIYTLPALLALLLSLTAPARAQSDFRGRLEMLKEMNAEEYTRPLATGTGIGLNGGVVRSADLHDLFGFDISLNMSGMVLPKSAKTYTYDISALSGLYLEEITIDGYQVSLDVSDVYSPEENAPTFYGSNRAPRITPDRSAAENAIVASVAYQSGLSEDQVVTQYGEAIQNAVDDIEPLALIPNGILDTRIWGMPSIQLSLGLPFSTEIQVRYLPTYNDEEGLGKFSLFGAGGRVDLDQFFPDPFFPVDIAAGAFFQKIQLGPVDISSNIYHIDVSRKLPMLTVYGGLGLEATTLTAIYPAYIWFSDSITVDLEVRGHNQFRGTIGIQKTVSIFAINLDYNLGTFQSINLSLGLSFR